MKSPSPFRAQAPNEALRVFSYLRRSSPMRAGISGTPSSTTLPSLTVLTP